MANYKDLPLKGLNINAKDLLIKVKDLHIKVKDLLTKEDKDKEEIFEEEGEMTISPMLHDKISTKIMVLLVEDQSFKEETTDKVSKNNNSRQNGISIALRKGKENR